MPLSAILDAAAPRRPSEPSTDAAVRRRFRQTTDRLERFGANESVAGVLTLILRNLAERAAREQGLVEAIA